MDFSITNSRWSFKNNNKTQLLEKSLDALFPLQNTNPYIVSKQTAALTQSCNDITMYGLLKTHTLIQTTIFLPFLAEAACLNIGTNEVKSQWNDSQRDRGGLLRKRGSHWRSGLDSDGHDEAGPVRQTLNKHCGSGEKVMKERICLQRTASNREIQSNSAADRTSRTPLHELYYGEGLAHEY